MEDSLDSLQREERWVIKGIKEGEHLIDEVAFNQA
jgi:hypothetical protein